MVYRGICLLYEEEETERLEELKQANPQLEDVEEERIVMEYIGETCKSIYTRSKVHLDSYRLMDKDSFILEHHVNKHGDVKLGEVKIRFETHKKHQTSFQMQIGEAVAIKLSRADPKRVNINNKFECTRCILPDIGALDPEPMEKARYDAEEKNIDKIRQKSKLLPVRMMEGSKKRDYPDATPN